MRALVITFPGSNCDDDCVRRFGEWGLMVQKHWYKDLNLPATDLIILPGGFSYGDYLRAGAIAARCPIMNEVKRFAERGGWVLGICNGFQILTEAKLLPGALSRHPFHHFVCRVPEVRAERASSGWIPPSIVGSTYAMPIANGEGRYMADAELLKRVEGEGLVAWRYIENFNDSKGAIAGLAQKRILGMMPHPERNAASRSWIEAWLAQ